MSRWQDDFKNHVFWSTWNSIVAVAETLIVDDETVQTSVEELARLKRVVVYLKEALEAIDAELTPKSTWDSFAAQSQPCLNELTQYNTNRNIQHLQNANQHLDNLLSYVKPYMIPSESVIKALEGSASAYRDQLEQYVRAFIDSSTAGAASIKGQHAKSDELIADISQNKNRVDDLVKDLIDGTENTPSIQASVLASKQDIDQKSAEITVYHKSLLIGEADSPSIKAIIDSAKSNVLENKESIETSIKNVNENISNITAFYVKIFGTKNSEGKLAGGLEQELDDRLVQLSDFEAEQKNKHETLFNKIEALLPGATSAGLAEAYRLLKEEFNTPIKTNTIIFYATIVFIFLVAAATSVEQWWPLIFIKYSDWETIIRGMLVKLPLIAPLIWLAIYAGTRRSQAARLQQEYAHKEALAKSYESYKKQIDILQASEEEREPLQRELIAKAIEAISYNASVTLDGNHREKLPLEQILATVSGDTGKVLTAIAELKKIG